MPRSIRAARWRPLVVAAVASLAAGLATAVPPAAAATPVQVTITVHSVWEVHCDDNDGTTCGNDYYARALFPDGERVSPRAPDDAEQAHPSWQLTGTVDRDAGPFGVRLQLWDYDDTSADDVLRIAGGGNDLNLTVNPATGGFTGNLPRPGVGYSAGTGEDSAAVHFTVSVGSGVADFDGDGIADALELSAIVDRFGDIPQGGDLRALRANGRPFTTAADPCRPTILVEIDHMDGTGHSHRPRQAALDEIVAAFDTGDVPARPRCPYPGFTSRPGVQMLIMVDDALQETDKLDFRNGPSGVTMQTIRNANFDPALRPYYHYSLWAHNQPDVTPPGGGDPRANGSSGLCCSDSGKDVLVTLGQWTGRTGTTREQSGTFTHELGHALGLGHGGGDADNCKPNYRSVMNYVAQTSGVPDASLPTPVVDLNRDGRVDARDKLRMDLSRLALPALDEDRLDERAGFSSNGDLFFWDSDNTMPWRSTAGNVAVDWDGDGSIDATPVAADINALAIPGGQGCPNASPPTGTVGIPEHNGHDDWANLRFRAPLSAPGSGHHVTADIELDNVAAELITAAVREAMSVADVGVTVTGAPQPVAAGTALTYTLRATNHGAANPAYGVTVTQTLPAGVVFSSAAPGCAHSDGVVTCTVDEVAPGATADRSVTVSVPASLAPGELTTSATVTLDGTDPHGGNDSASMTTTVVAEADLSVSKVGDRATATAGDPVTYTVTVANAGPSDAAGVRLTDDLPDPAEATFDGATATDGGSCALDAAGDLACSWPDVVPAGAVRTVTVTTTITDTGAAGSVTDTASVTSEATDPNAGNDSATVSTAVVKAATTVTATPVIAELRVVPGLGLRVYLSQLSARFARADAGRPVAGRELRFTTASGAFLCTATTDADGVARCTGVLTTLAAVLSLGYRVSATEDGRYLGATGTGPVLLFT